MYKHSFQSVGAGGWVSSEIFQKQLHCALHDLESIVCVADDIVVIGRGLTDAEAMSSHD